MLINSDEIKKHLNIELGYTDDDLYLTDLSIAAQQMVEHDLNRQLNECENQSVKLAILFLIATWYSNREAIGYEKKDIPKTYDYLINNLRNYR